MLDLNLTLFYMGAGSPKGGTIAQKKTGTLRPFYHPVLTFTAFVQ